MSLLFAWLKRRHDALWVQIVYMEPMAAPTWCVWVYRDGHVDQELARSRWLMIAIIAALFAPKFIPEAPHG